MSTFREELVKLTGETIKASIGNVTELADAKVISIHEDWVELEIMDQPSWKVPIGKINFFRS
jgi:hypothetical protein